MQSLISFKKASVTSLSLLFLLISLPSAGFAQQSHTLSGTVTDEYGHPLTGASVLVLGNNKGTATNRNGNFELKGLPAGRHILEISFLGYGTLRDSIFLEGNTWLNRQLLSSDKRLDEVTVTGQAQSNNKMGNSLVINSVSKDYIRTRGSGSLMQTLSRLPGVSSMNIGSGQSKPVIRGLGFNRVAVVENGIRHEAQEWGVDHGLEIDQFNTERIDIIKGPASLIYGANAIGGVIDLSQLTAPAMNSTSGKILFNMHSNNNLFATSAKFSRRFTHFYFKAHATLNDYADFRVPTDSIAYMTYYFRLKDNRLRNTAGKEQNGSLTLGYLADSFATHLILSNNFSKSGFFANAHGLEIRNSSINYDHSNRDTDLPYQQANHFKIQNNTLLMIKDYKVNINLGFQRNFRQEFSEAVAHGHMPVPQDSLERLYDKNTWTANLKMEMPIHSKHQLTTGFTAEYQQNRTGGWGFMIPNFNNFNGGIFLHDEIHLNNKWTASAGIRYDKGKIHTDAYYDWYPTPQEDGTEIFSMRATKLNRYFENFSWGMGTAFRNQNLTLKINIGKSFRMPTAKELSSNGINYHMYRYEKGDTALNAEQSYQLDLGLIVNKKKWRAEISPFINYFPNYIYMNPSHQYYEAQQIYFYSQSSVFRTGGEVSVGYKLTSAIDLFTDMEYIYAIQLSGIKKGFTLPFSPPLTSNIGFTYSFKENRLFQKQVLGVDLNLVGPQNNIVPPEKKTAGYALINLSAGTEIKTRIFNLEINMQLDNILNTRYYDHTSFYRLIEVPGQGRNFIITIQISTI